MIGRRFKDFLSRAAGEPHAPPRARSGVISVQPGTPAVRYVNALLSHTAEKRAEMTLRGPDTLPTLVGANEEVPTFSVVVNRLKFLSGLDPVNYPRPVRGSFRHVMRGRAWQIMTEFNDGGEAPSCRIAARDLLEER